MTSPEEFVDWLEAKSPDWSSGMGQPDYDEMVAAVRARDAALVETLARRIEADIATSGEFPYVNYYGASGWLRSQPEAKP